MIKITDKIVSAVKWRDEERYETRSFRTIAFSQIMADLKAAVTQYVEKQ